MGKEAPRVAPDEPEIHPDFDDRQTDGSEGPPPRRRKYRRIAGVFFASVIVYLVAVGLVSVIPQVFWPEPGEIPRDLGCRDGLAQLRQELLTYTSERVRDPSTDADLDPFFSDWDLRHLALEPRCAEGREQDAWQLLGRLRQRTEGTLERYAREEAELAATMDSTLAAPRGGR